METTRLHLNDMRKKEKQWMASVQDYIRSFTKHPFAGTPTGAVLDDAVKMGGKMLRPKLLLLAGQFGPEPEASRERLCKLAAMVELIHTASLIHDDVIDDAPSRRGELSLQRKYGKDAAVYAGDYLMSRMCQVIAREEMNKSGVILAETVEAMCAGEINQSLCRYKTDVTVSDYLKSIHGKTTALFMACCRIGATESGCDEETADRLERFGESLGILFQLRDDLLDFTSDTRTMGKEVLKDFQDGIYTMPVLFSILWPEGRNLLLPIMEENAKRRLTQEEIGQVVRLVNNLGGVEATRQQIYAQQQRAERILSDLCQGRYVIRTAEANALRAMLEKLVAV